MTNSYPVSDAKAIAFLQSTMASARSLSGRVDMSVTYDPASEMDAAIEWLNAEARWVTGREDDSSWVDPIA
jgi:hypothetical protein